MSLTATEVKDLITQLWTRVGSNRVGDDDLRTVGNAIVDLIAATNTDIFPDWAVGLTFQTDGSDDGKYCKHPDTTGKKRIFETKVDDNTGNAPPTDPLITENDSWKEISQSSKSAIEEWVPGVYGAGLIAVEWNHSTDGYGLYILTEPVRPFTSSDIEAEIIAGKWVEFGKQARDQAIAEAVTGLWDDRGNYDASSDLFPSSGGSGSGGSILKGDIWTVSVAGTLGSTEVSPGDTVRALVDTPGQTAANWAINQSEGGAPEVEAPNFTYTHDSTNKALSVVKDYENQPLLERMIYRLRPNHTVGVGGSDYTKALESILTYSKGELWIKFTGDDFDLKLERKIVVTTGTLATITPSVSRFADFQNFKKLIPKFLLKSGTGAATVDVYISVYNPKTMVEKRVYVERWELDDATTFGDKPWYPPMLATKYLQGIISHPYYTRIFLVGVSGTLNDADYLFEKTQAAYATIKTVRAKQANVNDRGYLVIPFTCELANCLQVTLNNSAGSSVITDQFVMVKS